MIHVSQTYKYLYIFHAGVHSSIYFIHTFTLSHRHTLHFQVGHLNWHLVSRVWRNNIPLWKYYDIHYADIKRCCYFFIANGSTLYQNQNQVMWVFTVHNLNLKFTSFRTCLKRLFTLLNITSVVVF